MGIYDNEKRMWFGTEERMGWIECPLSGADVSPVGWSADATMLNGGGFALNSWASHKRFAFGWGESATLDLASTIHSYADGSYGRGLLYFLDPMWYEVNVLPKHWADPSMALNDEAPTLIYDNEPTSTPTSPNTNGLPVQTTIYTPTRVGFDQADSLFIPIPDGYSLILGAVYTSTGTGGVFYSPVASNGTTGAPVRLSGVSANAATLNQTRIDSDGLKGVRLWIGKTSGAASTVAITGMIARIANTALLPTGAGGTIVNSFTNPSFTAPGTPYIFQTNYHMNPRWDPTGGIGLSRTGTTSFAFVNVGGEDRMQFATTTTGANAAYLSPHARRMAATLGTVVHYRIPVYNAGPGTRNFVAGFLTSSNAPTSGTFTALTQYNAPSQMIPAGGTFIFEGFDTVTDATAQSVQTTVGRQAASGAAAGDLVQVGPVYLSTDPPPVGMDTFAGSDPASFDSTFAFTGPAYASTSTRTVTPPAGIPDAGVYRTEQWSSEGSYALRVPAGRTVTRTLTATTTVAVVAHEVGQTLTVDGTPYTSIAIGQTLRGTGSASAVLGPGDWDLLTQVAGSYAGVPFSGNTPGFAWNGTPNASTSFQVVPIITAFLRNDWAGGQGHTGCRFLGKPTLVNYNGVMGGQVGLGATFVEVGGWLD